ncbi:RluA family pseudouridine synthase [Breznakiellaceae bacterium SP9]
MPSFSCTALTSGQRLDRYAALELKLLPRSQMKRRSFQAACNGKPAKLSRLVKAGDSLEFTWDEPQATALVPEDLRLDVLYEDERVLVVNKAQGMIVHPGAGVFRGTLANAVLYRAQKRDNTAFQGPRPGIVHRLDKDTSGVIIAAYDEEAVAFLSSQFKARSVRKIYGAIVQGIPPAHEDLIETYIARDPRERKRFAVWKPQKGGKFSVTRYKLIHSWHRKHGNQTRSYSLLLLRPKTGRTHQLRVHLKSIGCPILGDSVYGVKDTVYPNASLMLHAKSLSIVLPAREEPAVFSAPFPERFLNLEPRAYH